MSKCISREGEYGEHVLDPTKATEFTCQRCFVFDEDEAVERVLTAEGKLTAIHEAVIGGYATDEDPAQVVGRIHTILVPPVAQPVEKPPCTEYHWVGQSPKYCDACGKPYWEHETDRNEPIPDELRAAVKKKWGRA